MAEEIFYDLEDVPTDESDGSEDGDDRQAERKEDNG